MSSRWVTRLLFSFSKPLVYWDRGCPRPPLGNATLVRVGSLKPNLIERLLGAGEGARGPSNSLEWLAFRLLLTAHRPPPTVTISPWR
jgi:hypothetical protein